MLFFSFSPFSFQLSIMKRELEEAEQILHDAARLSHQSDNKAALIYVYDTVRPGMVQNPAWKALELRPRLFYSVITIPTCRIGAGRQILAAETSVLIFSTFHRKLESATIFSLSICMEYRKEGALEACTKVPFSHTLKSCSTFLVLRPWRWMGRVWWKISSSQYYAEIFD